MEACSVSSPARAVGHRRTKTSIVSPEPFCHHLPKPSGDWQRIGITGAVLRDEITLNDNLPLISSENWPTFESFRDAVSAYHKAARDAQNIWMNMNDTERTGLSPPHGM